MSAFLLFIRERILKIRRKVEGRKSNNEQFFIVNATTDINGSIIGIN
ncbi:hypothetical protein D349_01232 [Enterococcus faecalis UP2S-6]|nr:hypothetical protein D349_01232 [Enterococcus faecalis UP2S-6]